MSVFQMLIWAALSALRSRYFFCQAFARQKNELHSARAAYQCSHLTSNF